MFHVKHIIGSYFMQFIWLKLYKLHDLIMFNLLKRNKLIKNKKSIILLNKCDLSQKNDETINYISKLNKTVLRTSMRTKEGIDELYKTISNMFRNNEVDLNDGVIITNVRHKNQIHKAIESITGTTSRREQNLPIDLIAIDIKNILEELGEITGDNVSEDIIQKIFSKFCLGK